MSLRVWLPLNGDLRNNGLSDIAITNNGATVDNSGKIGKCYSFNGSSSKITNTFSTPVSSSIGSLACWVKFNAFPANNKWYTLLQLGNLGGYATCRLGLYMEYTDKICVSVDGSSQKNLYTHSLQINQWYHICTTYDGNIIKLYIDGIEVMSVTAIKGTYTTDSSYLYIGATNNYWLNGYMNDARYYDHALSANEIKEISKGLVCHYKLDNNSIQQMNNCFNYPTFNTSDTAGGWFHWGSSGHVGTYGQNTDKQYIYRKNQTYSHWFADGETATKDYLLYQSPAFEGGFRSLCCIVKEENSLPITESIVYPAWNANVSGGATVNQWTSVRYLRDGFYLCKCEGLKQDGSNDLVGIHVKPGYKVYVSECYLENDRTVCSDIQYFSNTEYDSSGNNYNVTIVGSPTVSSDTPRNSLSTCFVTPSYGKATLNPTGYADSYTFAFWAVYSANNSMAFGHANGNKLNLYFNSGYILWNTGDSNNNPFQNNGTNVSNTSYMNSWHHYAITGDGTSSILYIDGEYVGTAKTHRPITGTTLILSGWSADTSTSYRLNNKISDFRIYATALSADDVKELYNIGASIDKGNNLHTYELLESGSNELLAVPYTNWYSQHNDIPSNWYKNINNGEIYFESTTVGSHAAGSRYISINPTNKTYYYDFCISVSAGNLFYIGFERYDKDKTARSNNATVYIFGSKPSSDLVKARYKGTVNLSTDGVNPCAFIALRILNRWSGSTTETEGKATVHYLSLREVDNTTGFETTQLFKTGVFKTDLFLEKNDKVNIEKTGIINATNQFIEI